MNKFDKKEVTMVESKAWDWNKESSLIWKTPCEESYYYCNKWKSEGRKKLLDLGCGIGRHQILFSKEGFDVTAVDLSAVDLSDEAVKATIQWRDKLNLNFEVMKMDIQDLTFLENSFDCIWSYMVVSHTDTLGFFKLINDLEKILKPNGALFITICSKEATLFKRSEKIVDCNTIIKSNEGSEKNVPHFYANLDDIQKIFKNFKLVRVRHIDNCCFDGKVTENRHYYVEAVLQ